MATRDMIYEVLTGGFRKKGTARHGHEIRRIGYYEDGEWITLSGATGLGTASWIEQNSQEFTWNTITDIPKGDSWYPYRAQYDLDGGENTNKYHGESPATQAYYAAPGVSWMWPAGTLMHDLFIEMPNEFGFGEDKPTVNGVITQKEWYCEIRHESLPDKDGFIANYPISFYSTVDFDWGLFNQNHFRLRHDFVPRKFGSVEFIFKMDKPGNFLTYYNPVTMEAGYDTDYSHEMRIVLGVSGVDLQLKFGILGQEFLNYFKVTSDHVTVNNTNGPIEFVGGILCFAETDDVPDQGFVPSISLLKDSDGIVKKFEWNKWYRCRIRWEMTTYDDKPDIQINVQVADPYEQLEEMYFNLIESWDVDTEINVPDEDTFTDTLSIRRVHNLLLSIDYDLAQTYSINSYIGPVSYIKITDGQQHKSPQGQMFHVANIGYSWDPDYIEYGLDMEISQDPKPAVLEALVTEVLKDDVTITLTYYPAIFDEMESFIHMGRTMYERKYNIKVEESTYTFTVPKYTRPGKIYEGPSDFGHLVSVDVSGDEGKIEIHAILGDGAKLIHALKDFDLRDAMYKARQSLAKGPRLCPRCNGTDPDCTFCDGKKYRYDDFDIPEFILDNFLRNQDAPMVGATMQEKIGMALVLSFYVNPSLSEIKRLFATVYDISESAISSSITRDNQNVICTLSVPQSLGDNAIFEDYSRAQWILDTLRPLGVTYIYAEKSPEFTEEFENTFEHWDALELNFDAR